MNTETTLAGRTFEIFTKVLIFSVDATQAVGPSLKLTESIAREGREDLKELVQRFHPTLFH
jgi:hypothetical protein